MSDPSPQSPPPPPPAPTRPYTSYNLFFQLEREYILQTLHNHTPTIPPHEEAFDPTAMAPPLPARYANLILPYDWHIPGKAKRRKRIHRKSHGKIGFHELNERISRAWSAADDDIRNFCTCLSDIESRKYKTNVKGKRRKRTIGKKNNKKKATRKHHIEDDKVVATWIKSSEANVNNDDGNFSSFDWTVNCPISVQEKFAIDPYQHENISSAPKIRRKVSHGSSFKEVDMEDDEIIDMWKTTDLEEVVEDKQHHDAIHSIYPICQACTEITSPTTIIVDTAKVGGEEEEYTRNSYIDAKYERFRELGKQKLLGKTRLLSKFARKAVTPGQA